MRRVWLGLPLLIGLLLVAPGCGGKATKTPSDPAPLPNGKTGSVYDTDSSGEG